MRQRGSAWARIHGILRRALAPGVRRGRLGVNSVASATQPRVPQPEITPPQNVATMLNVYSHVVPEADREAADILGQLASLPDGFSDVGHRR